MSDFAGLAPCVHCGFCLQSCPTFLVTGDEADSPRGRIVLMQALAAGAVAPDDPALVEHLDRCLGCRGCEPACPSGVSYGPALEAARERIAAARPVPVLGRILLTIMARPGLRGVLLALTRALRPLTNLVPAQGRVGFMAGMVAASRPATGQLIGGGATAQPLDHGRAAARGDRSTAAATAQPLDYGRAAARGDRPTAIFQGCIQSGLFSHVNAAAERTLAANGHALVRVQGQGCCGALHAHAGLLDQARALARVNVVAFNARPDAAIAVTAAGCGAMLASYGDLLADDPLAREARALSERSHDVTKLLEQSGPRPGAPLTARVAYDPPCHLLHAQRVAEAPHTVLAAIPGLALVAHDEAELCCGGAGIFGLLQPAMSQAVLARKVSALQAAAPDAVATGNPGCAMQIGAGLRAAGTAIPVVHPVELLDVSYAAAGYYDP